MNKKTIGIFIGSLRKQSYSKKVGEAIIKMMPEDFNMQLIDMEDLPIFNQDFEEENRTPEEWLRLRETIKQLDGFLFITPEYNRSIPPVLKNAIDIVSRPPGQNLWNGKPGGIISVSPGRTGGFGANHHLRQVLTCLNVYTMQQPEAYIGDAANLFDESGVLHSDQMREVLQGYANAFAGWVRIFMKDESRNL